MKFKVQVSATYYTVQKMKFSIKNFLRKCDQIRSFLRIWLRLLKKSFMENFIFCAVLLGNIFILFLSVALGTTSFLCSTCNSSVRGVEEWGVYN